ncbi:MAG: M48 family metallopeptidase [Desulfobacterales bacterium]|nr:M48 family metallopeptidase [Desulfobacterales bacterium]
MKVFNIIFLILFVLVSQVFSDDFQQDIFLSKNFFDLINKDKIDKTKNLIEGAGTVLSSSRELDYNSEFAIGESIALEGFKRYGLPVDNPELQKYVNLVGNAVVRNSSRSTIPYYFVVIDSPLYNAFACPGGIIFISSALFKGIYDESELACVLAHEVAHVSHKHALQTLQRAKFFEGLGKISAATMKGDDAKKFQNAVGELQKVLFDHGLDKDMEFESDMSGMEIAYRTGYDPSGMVRVLSMLKGQENSATKKGSWYSTHPPLNDRIQKCLGYMKKYPDGTTLAKVRNRLELYKKKLAK